MEDDYWLSDEPIDIWYGVITDVDGRMVLLFPHANELSGEIPPELGNLAKVESLSFAGNHLTGEIPPELGNLANLESLNFAGNQLSGCVPGSLQDQLELESTYLGDLEFC